MSKWKKVLKAVGAGKATDGNAIRQEYYNKCAQAGELQYKIGEFEKALKNLNNEIAQLNETFGKLNEAEKNANQATQPATTEAPKA